MTKNFLKIFWGVITLPESGESISTDKEKYFKEAKRFNSRVFKSKDKMRRRWAKMPIEAKIVELVKLQELTAALHPELKKIIPWKLKK